MSSKSPVRVKRQYTCYKCHASQVSKRGMQSRWYGNDQHLTCAKCLEPQKLDLSKTRFYFVLFLHDSPEETDGQCGSILYTNYGELAEAELNGLTDDWNRVDLYIVPPEYDGMYDCELDLGNLQYVTSAVR